MALLHLIFYVPLACVRVAALFATAIGVAPETALLLTGASFVCYVFAGTRILLFYFILNYQAQSWLHKCVYKYTKMELNQ